MHVELVVPALLPASVEASLPSLELLLARGRRRSSEATGFESWLSLAFSLESKTLPAGALSALGSGIDPGDRFWLRADPVHLRADRDRLLLFPGQGLALAAAEAELLADALMRHFADRFMLRVLRPDVWVLEIRQEFPSETGEAALHSKPPLELAGQSVDPNLPEKRWHALLNEIQMAMYQHPVNTEREERGAPVVNSVWPWGGGRLPAAARAPWQSVSAQDLVALGLAKVAGARAVGTGAGAKDWLGRAPDAGRHLFVLDALRAPSALGDRDAMAQGLRALEERWMAPLLAALRAERIGMVTVHAPEAGLSFETIRGDLRRFWRRPRPLHSLTG
jgi:hypothetical protein